MNKHIVILLSAALILIFTVQINAVFVVQSPIPTPSPTPTVRYELPIPIKVTRVLYEHDIISEPVLARSKSESPRRFEFKLGNLDWDDIWDIIEDWIERGW